MVISGIIRECVYIIVICVIITSTLEDIYFNGDDGTNGASNHGIKQHSLSDNVITDEDMTDRNLGYHDDNDVTSPKDRMDINRLQNYAKEQMSLKSQQKRMSMGFYGSRGKKMAALSNAFYGSRGKKSASPQAFYGSRGKRRAIRSTTGHIYYAGGKRIDPNSFFGMRGKRTEEESYPLLVPQQQYYKTIPQQQLSLDGPQYYYGDGEEDVLGYPLDDDTSVLDEMRSKERLQALVNYYLKLKSHRNSLSYWPSSALKVKRQPPSGFHAIRGR